MSFAGKNLVYQRPPQAGRSTEAGAELRPPYLIYFGDVGDRGHAKTGLGIIQWRRELCIGQMRSAGCGVDGGIPDMTVADAVRAGAKSLVIGVAPAGGSISANWMRDLVTAAEQGLDVVSGMHARLTAFPEIVAAAKKSCARLVDVRTSPPELPIGTGERRSGKRLLTVGTDCAVGKKYTALAIEQEMQSRGWNVDFRATGQTGIMISGSGIAIDSVVSDFVSGAAEILSPAASDDHWDVIEGQGALSHPSYAGVSLGLLHGSQPDALVLCHDPSRDVHLGLEGMNPGYPILSLRESVDQCLSFARRVNPKARFVGISINSSAVPAAERASLYERFAKETNLPVVDPIVDGAKLIVDKIEAEGVAVSE